MNAAKSVTATFDLQSFAVNVNKVGNGTITSTPAGIDCGAVCASNYVFNTDVTLTALPGPDSLFTGWSGACSDSATDCLVKVDAAKSVTATFALKSFLLNVGTVGNGSVSSVPAGITCGGDCSESYMIATPVALTALPAADSLFTGWSGACAGTTPTCNVIIDAAKNATATFALKIFSVTVTLSGEGGGTVTSAPAGITCGVDCTGSYNLDTLVTLTALPDGDSVFAGWGGECTGEQTTCTVTVNKIINVSAAFAVDDSRVLLPLITP